MALISREILDWLVKYIENNELVVGDVLPGEIELASRLSVGRSSVREAYSALKTFGVAKSQQSIGLILISDPRRLSLMSLFTHENFTIAEYHSAMQLRNIMELGAVGEILANCTPEDVEILHELVRKIHPDVEQISPLDFEIEFHEHLARLSGNKFMIGLSLLYRPLFEYHMEHYAPEAKQSMTVQDVSEHADIVEALSMGDRGMLETALRKQLGDEYKTCQS